MKVTKTDAGFDVEFSIALKDDFKRFFPSARWDHERRVWTVGPRSGKRLEQWVAEFQDIEEGVTIRQEAEFTEQQIIMLRSRADALRNQIGPVEALRDRMITLRKQFIEASDRLQEVQAELTVARADASKAQADALTIIVSAVDMTVVRKAAAVMAKNMVPSVRECKRVFNDAQALVVQQCEALEKIGFRCRAMQLLRFANVNRPDRDHPKFIKAEDWLNIWKIEDQE